MFIILFRKHRSMALLLVNNKDSLHYHMLVF